MNQHIIQWAAPSPLWSELITNGSTRPVEGFGAPAILRFATDDFMQKYQDTLSTDPLKLGEFRAVPDTWRGALAQPKLPTPARSFALSYQRRGASTRAPVPPAKATSSSDAAEPPTQALPAGASTLLPDLGLPRLRLAPDCRTAKSMPANRKRLALSCAAHQADNGSLTRIPARYAWPIPALATSGKVRGDDDTSDAVIVTNEERLPLFSDHLHEDDFASATRQRNHSGGETRGV
jgi:hypothetical protein